MSETVTTVVQQFEDGTQVPQPGFSAFTPSSSSGVTSFNTRTGAVTLAAADVNAVGAITNNTSGSAASATSATTATTANAVAAGSTVTTPNIVGVTNASSAAAGSVGEFVQTLVALGSAINLTANVAASVASIALTAGDWDVEGSINFGADTTSSVLDGAINTSVAIPTDGSQSVATCASTSTASFALTRKRINVSGATTVYLVALAGTVSAGRTAYGQISARRVR